MVLLPYILAPTMPFYIATRPIVKSINIILNPASLIFGAVSIIYCIIVGVKFAKAEEQQGREKARAGLRNTVTGLGLIFVLINLSMQIDFADLIYDSVFTFLFFPVWIFWLIDVKPVDTIVYSIFIPILLVVYAIVGLELIFISIAVLRLTIVHLTEFADNLRKPTSR